MSPSPGDNPDRTIPEWLDPQNMHGQLYYMVLKAVDGHTLPSNPFMIGRSIEKHAGKIEGAFYDRNQKCYVLKIRNKDQGRHLTLLKKLEDGSPIEIGRHPSLNQRKFVVRCSEVQGMTEEEITSELKAQKISHVRRITKKTSAGIVGTPTLVLTINSTIIPEFVNFGLLKVRTRVYIPQPLLCRLCYRYGHPKKRCTFEKACSICCSTKHDSSACPGEKFCHTCQSSDHSPSDRNCPKWIAESTVLKMSVEKNITPAAARQMVTTNNNAISYAEIARSAPAQSKQQQRNGNTQKSTHHTVQIVQQQQQQQEANVPKQQQQKRDRPVSSSPASSLNVESPPRKKSPSRPVRSATAELSIEAIETDAECVDKPTNYPNPSPPSPPSNPFQPPQPPSFKMKLHKPPGT